MIKQSDLQNIPYDVIKYLEKDPARNYFILLGILDKKPIFKNLFLQYNGKDVTSVLFQRNSGTLQFYSASQDFDSEEIKKQIGSLDYPALISPYSYTKNIYDENLFSRYEKRGYICKLEQDDFIKNSKNVIKDAFLDIYKGICVDIGKYNLTLKALDISMLDSLEELYKEVFHSYASRDVMQSRLSDKRGRGYVLCYNDKIISAVQSEFESVGSAVIVGVATSKAFQKNGFAGFLLQLLCSELLKEGKKLYLQFDNSDAGKIYYSMGFNDMDRVVHYFK